MAWGGAAGAGSGGGFPLRQFPAGGFSAEENSVTVIGHKGSSSQRRPAKLEKTVLQVDPQKMVETFTGMFSKPPPNMG